MRSALLLLFALFPFDAAAQRNDCLKNGVCPDAGCAESDAPDAEANRLRNAVFNSVPKFLPELDVQDFEGFQRETDRRKLGHQGLAIFDRSRYQGLRFPVATDGVKRKRSVGEKLFVSLVGYIVGTPRAAAGESANCFQSERDNNSFRLNIAAYHDDTEFDSVIVVVTPRMRRLRQAWSFENLAAIAHSGRPVRITGPLFYDSKHRVNSDPHNELPNEPRRLSLWEIHPVAKIELCTQRKPERCMDPATATWENLEEARWLR